MPKQGLHLITPSAAVATGTGSSATINANGSVTFSTVTALELRGVFSADYDNYQIVARWTQATAAANTYLQMVSGTSVDSTANYTWQRIEANGTTLTSSRASGQTVGGQLIGDAATTYPQGFITFVYGPYLAQPTVGRTLGVTSTSNASLIESAWSHNVSSSFDGGKLSVLTGTASGLVCVYGMRK